VDAPLELVTVPQPRPTRRSREHDIGELGGLRQEEVLDDEELEPSRRCRARVWSASDWSGFSPMQ
jgi:hypothetical protein